MKITHKAKAMAFSALLGFGAVGLGGYAFTSAPAAASDVTVFKSPYCGCCGDWIRHMEANGFKVTAKDVEDLAPIKKQHGLWDEVASCHTAVVDGYVVEGHVPAEDVKRLLAERHKARGLAVPGMPLGSPGMESAVKEPFEVLMIGLDGSTSVFAQY
ncbi:DUF411 domain-containing protein [Telmatospirillum sp. J64-1]|uniref:DUF411 domain-containing protein n=1 Tax=Telmatospirillum sp. J64-1 TaxID=2502183 RepID=UPI002104508F|nr:DUF411 domain-containing protein [Telmatospirillum sp. J64-1]